MIHFFVNFVATWGQRLLEVLSFEPWPSDPHPDTMTIKPIFMVLSLKLHIVNFFIIRHTLLPDWESFFWVFWCQPGLKVWLEVKSIFFNSFLEFCHAWLAFNQFYFMKSWQFSIKKIEWIDSPAYLEFGPRLVIACTLPGYL